jgi:hypothetical protein
VVLLAGVKPPDPPLGEGRRWIGGGRTQRTDVVLCIMLIASARGWGETPFASALSIRPLCPLSASALCVHYQRPPGGVGVEPPGVYPRLSRSACSLFPFALNAELW